MEKFSAGYVHTNNNFVILNLPSEKSEENKYYPVYCVLKNILHRGCPTIMSEFLQQNIGSLHLLPEFNRKVFLIDNSVPIWKKNLKNGKKATNFLAHYFFEEVIPEYLSEYRFIQQLILPDVSISEIPGIRSWEFNGQRVDFYLPQAKLAILIDEQPYELHNIGSYSSYLERYLRNSESGMDIEIIELPENVLKRKNDVFLEKINKIKMRLGQFEFDKISEYRKAYWNENYYKDEYVQKALLATAVIRFQTLLLELLQRDVISIDSEVWNFNVLDRDNITKYAELAGEDTFIWLEHLFKLNKLMFKKPKIDIKYCHDYSDFIFEDGYINVDFSVKKRWTDEYSDYPDIIFVRTDYFDDANYFKVNTAQPIKYNIITEGKESDVPSLKFFLRNIFGFEEFYDGQLPIIINALTGKDTIGLLPTGGGKSLCYQLSALLQPAISFVVSPIKSLMYDQKVNLDKFYITRTNYITSDLYAKKKSFIGKEFADGKYLFIWISPERFQIQEFRDYLRKLKSEQTIALAVIDEVHCLSEWGHDFRTSYLNLVRTIRKYCPSAWLLGLTATASAFVLEDLKVEFGIGNENIKTLPTFTRPELRFIVYKDRNTNYENKKRTLINLLERLNQTEGIFKLNGEQTKSGIIFTLFKNEEFGCYALAREISRIFNVNVKWYSGEIPEYKKSPVIDSKKFDKYKLKVQKEYKENKISLLVATKAFGMGIDKKNIRYTIHFGLPASVEALYQEAGRAGRDRKPAKCYVLYTKENIKREEMEKLFNPNSSVEEIREILQKYRHYRNDVLRIFFLWLMNNKGVEEESKIIRTLFENFAEPNKAKTISCKDTGLDFSDLQKAIYRLSLLEIVDDWTIENWSKGSEVLKVYFSYYNKKKVISALLNYINRYDKEFSLDKKLINNKKYGKYVRIYMNNSLHFYDEMFMILVEWIYDNIVYSRRQAIKNILELCENFRDSESFKEELENYFRFTETSYLLDHISHNPTNYKSWFQVFYKPKARNELIDKTDAENIKGSLSRLLENYRYNTGLNFVSGMIRLMINDFDNQDGRNRLESALEQIETYDEKVKSDIFEETLKLKRLFKNNKSRIELSKVLLYISPNQVERVYKELNDYYSLNLILKKSVGKLRRIGGLIYE
ncbi:MAG: RecQ family ATP-dependent DNA helicase [Fervidobacterium sp.]|uniref:RecQ family ATP-dependent DNA helicase n=1 Tax=Fervidobacterium sp. TaxID=1871331 RepID=UPI00404BA0BA